MANGTEEAPAEDVRGTGGGGALGAAAPALAVDEVLHLRLTVSLQGGNRRTLILHSAVGGKAHLPYRISNDSSLLLAFRQRGCQERQGWELLGSREACVYAWDDPKANGGKPELQLEARDSHGHARTPALTQASLTKVNQGIVVELEARSGAAPLVLPHLCTALASFGCSLLHRSQCSAPEGGGGGDDGAAASSADAGEPPARGRRARGWLCASDAEMTFIFHEDDEAEEAIELDAAADVAASYAAAISPKARSAAAGLLPLAALPLHFDQVSTVLAPPSRPGEVFVLSLQGVLVLRGVRAPAAAAARLSHLLEIYRAAKYLKQIQATVEQRIAARRAVTAALAGRWARKSAALAVPGDGASTAEAGAAAARGVPTSSISGKFRLKAAELKLRGGGKLAGGSASARAPSFRGAAAREEATTKLQAAARGHQARRDLPRSPSDLQ